MTTGLFVGLATLDVVQLVDRLPARNEKTIAQQTWLAAGGPAAVAAIAFAALGGRARLWTVLGASPAARLAASDLASAGVEVIDVAPPGFELAASTVFLDAASGERAVVSGSGTVPAFGKIAGPDLAGVDVVLVDGHHAPLARSAALAARHAVPEERAASTFWIDDPLLRSTVPEERAPASVTATVPEERAPASVTATVPEERAPASVTKGRDAGLPRDHPSSTGGGLDGLDQPGAAGGGIPVVVDAGSHKAVFDDVLPFATDVICSADYRHPAGLGPRDLLGLGPQLVAVSHGGSALEWWTAAGSGSIAPEPVRAIDTLSAGDVLHGAYCHALASGLDRVDALQRAVAVATARVRHLGPFGWRAAIS